MIRQADLHKQGQLPICLLLGPGLINSAGDSHPAATLQQQGLASDQRPLAVIGALWAGLFTPLRFLPMFVV